VYEQGGFFYMCGGAGGFGASVTRVMKENVFMLEGGLGRKDADALFASLSCNGRFQEDLAE
jgi:sulfite reductase alpha subunit-like flavoprotein